MPLDTLTDQPRVSAPDPTGNTVPLVTGLGAAQRLAEITGIGPVSAQVVIAEIGLDMTRFPTAAHLVSWAKLSPRTIQSGAVHRGGKTGRGNPYLKGRSARPPQSLPAPTPSSARGTAASSNAAAS